MGTSQMKCMYCKAEEMEDNPILKIHSRDKYRGINVCWVCLKRKIQLIIEYENRISRDNGRCHV